MKNQLKKSLSLLMAVLMILSCWVWIAPDKAEAATSGYYPLTLVWDVKDEVNGGSAKVTVTYTTNNGTGTSTSKEYSMDALKSNTGSVTWSQEIPGFPTNISIKIDNEGMRQFEMVLKSITIAGRTIGTGDWTFQSTWGSASKNYPQAGGGDWGTVDPTTTWTKPFLNTATATLNPTSHTLAKINSGTNSTSTISLSGFVDDYNIDWLGSVTPTFTLRADGDVTLGSNATITGSGNSRTITIKPWFQTLYPGKQNAKLYIDWTATGGSGKKTGTETITVDFPTYKATFDANGGKIGADDSEAKDTIEYTGDKMNIGSVIGKAPAYAAKAGFEFKGFYSRKNSDATGKTASFSGTKFEDGVTTVPHTKGTGEGQYDTDEDFYGDTVWYAAWQALPITATFMTADNQLIGTVEGRYNNYMTASNMYNGDAGLNAAVKASHTAGKVQFDSNNTPVYTDGSTTYTFAGWKIIKAYDESVVDGNEDTVLHGDVTFQAVYTKADAKTYTVTFEDGNGNTMITQSGKKYRDLITGITYEPTKATDDKYNYEFIGWAKDIGKNAYVVDETDRDENGATIVYTHKDGAEFIVKGDASYVPVFRMIPREYTVTYKYNVDGAVQQTTLIEGYHWHDGVKMPEIKDNYTNGGFRYYIDGWTVGNSTEVKKLDEITVEGDMTLTAHYGAGQAAEYTINFYGKDTDGVTDVLLNGDNNIYAHNTTVTAPEVPQTIDTEDALYTFAGWSPSIKTTATGDADYYATYTKKDYADLHFYNYDGTLIYELDGKENGLFVGDTIPAYENLVDGEKVLPEKPEDVVGTYNFTGWADGNGNEVVPGTDKFTADTYLTAQFETVYKKYTVKFVNEGQVTEAEYKYGDEITVPADPTKAADVEYIYDFRAWSPDVSAVCYGDATYTATYRRTPQYYKVTWLNDAKAVHSESNYTYNAKIQQAVINAPVSYDPAGEGKTWAFKHWVQCDANGNDILVDGAQVLFVRGQRMGSEQLYFYPVFEEVANVLTVTFYKEDGTSLLGEAKIPYGKSIDEYDEAFKAKAPKASDADYHYVIENWVNVNGGATVTTINADVSVKATYTAEPHDKQIYEVVAEPTANVPGYAHYKCEADECTAIDYNVAIAPVADEGDPIGQIYVGTQKWTHEDYEAGINYDDIKFVGPNTQLIVNAEDVGTESKPWNAEGKLSRGVGKIEYYVANGKVDDPSTITKWDEIYNIEENRQEALNVVLAEKKITLVEYNGYIRGTAEEQMKKAEIDRAVDTLLEVYNANATGIVSNLNLENGKSYVIYIRVSDREGNGEVNTRIFSSGTISYGSTAPEIAVAGEGYGTKFCADATVTVTDDTDGFKAYLDGTEITLTNGKFTCEEKGLHTVTVIDKHGNKTTKTFEIKGNHTYRNYTTLATCETAGSRYDLCTVCGAKANEEVLPAIGHSYTANYVDKAATCVVDGTRTYVCDNNCGTKLVLKPTDDAATLAQAKKYVEAEDEEAEGTWVDLTADDLKHLKATGEHTYAMVKDENGDDTDEYVWVIDKAATCLVPGSQHRDCTVCGLLEARVTEEIPLDTENGHKFYREKVTLEPTCTETGKRTKTCRYCAETVLVETLPALGHEAGEYRIITAATCDKVGSKILTCSRCSTAETPVDIGEPIKDENGNVTGFDGNAVEIKALGHAYKAEGEIFQAGDGKWYQKYVCKNDNTHVENREVEGYEPPVAATVTFMNGEAAFATVSGFVGDTISASEVAGEPVKAADATKTYTFSHWAIKNADGTYTEVKFPIEVKGDVTYYAVYSERFVNYTITYYKEDGTTEFKKTGYLHNGDEVALADGPSKAETKLVKYVFAGWKDINGTETYTDKVTIKGANINLKATYTEVKKQYAVTYAYSSSNILETFAVEAGTAARDCAITPVKEADSKYHYNFKAWNKAEQLKNVESNIYTTPDFEAALHSFDAADGGKTEVKTSATCTSNAVYTYTCACGYTYSKEEANTALGHLWGEPVYDEETGKNVVTCQRGCGTSQEDTRTFTVKFTAEGAADKTVSYIPWGTTIDALRLPADPTKESTATYEYKFKGWALKDDATNAIVDIAKLVVKQDYEFVAVFEAVVRKYTVIFAYDANNVIETHKNVEAGSSVSFGGATPTKAPDVNYHYSFKGWSGSTADVQGNVYVKAEFDKAEHTYSSFELNEATCTNGTGTRYYCDCNGNGKFDEKVNGEFVDHYYDVTGKPLEHNWQEIKRVEATPNTDGYIDYKCTACTETKRVELKYADNTVLIRVRVLHNGAAESGVKVEIQNAVDGSVIFATTNKDGYALFTVSKDGVYTCYVEKNGKNQVALELEGSNYVGTYSYTDAADCTCACHRDNLWGAIFRFFHKIIKLFTGQFKCCGNPDPMYG